MTNSLRGELRDGATLWQLLPLLLALAGSHPHRVRRSAARAHLARGAAGGQRANFLRQAAGVAGAARIPSEHHASIDHSLAPQFAARALCFCAWFIRPLALVFAHLIGIAAEAHAGEFRDGNWQRAPAVHVGFSIGAVLRLWVASEFYY